MDDKHDLICRWQIIADAHYHGLAGYWNQWLGEPIAGVNKPLAQAGHGNDELHWRIRGTESAPVQGSAVRLSRVVRLRLGVGSLLFESRRRFGAQLLHPGPRTNRASAFART